MPAATKSTADPVSAARADLEKAQQAEQDARTRLEDFKARILDGDESVGAADYASAAHQAEHAELRTRAAARRLADAQRDARLAELDALAAEILGAVGDPAEALAEWEALRQAAATFVTRLRERQRGVAKWTARMRKLGVPQLRPKDELSAEHRHLGWRDAAMGAGDRVFVGGREIQAIDPGSAVAAAIVAGARDAGIKHLPLNARADIAADPAAWFAARW